jgi:hypothetical protein
MHMVINCNWTTARGSKLASDNPGPHPFVRIPSPPVALSPCRPVARPPSNRHADSPVRCAWQRDAMAGLGRGSGGRVAPGALWFTVYRLRIAQTERPRAFQHGARGRSWGHGGGRSGWRGITPGQTVGRSGGRGPTSADVRQGHSLAEWPIPCCLSSLMSGRVDLGLIRLPVGTRAGRGDLHLKQRPSAEVRAVPRNAIERRGTARICHAASRAAGFRSLEICWWCQRRCAKG